jgi:hypothetical protein
MSRVNEIFIFIGTNFTDVTLSMRPILSATRWTMSDWTKAHDEPLLAEILADPIIQALMARDRVEHRDIERLMRKLNEADRSRDAESI